MNEDKPTKRAKLLFTECIVTVVTTLRYLQISE